MKHLIVMMVLLSLLFSLTGCNLPTVPEEIPSTEIPVVPVTETVAPTKPPEPSTDTPEAPPPTEPPEPVIEHIMLPKFGDGKAQTIHDQTSDKTAPEKRAYGGDEFVTGRYERPFTGQEMEYLPYIDLVRADLYRDKDNIWAYATLEGISSPSLSNEHTIYYALELDEDLDGRGDSLIVAQAPPSDEWTTDGVQIWQDVNNNIGAEKVMQPDAGGAGDGYEVLVFDAGKGDDADMAWVRLNSEKNNRIEIAFKLDLVDIGKDYTIFLWGAWAFADEVHPEWFDAHDTFSLEEAGSPLKDNAAYPLKAFAAADNTCRALSGMEPTGNMPGMCPYTPPTTTNNSSSSCAPINCCTTFTTACMLHFNPVTCQCEP
jgi:hypothetical protein